MHYKKHTLRNGLRVLLAPMADVESVTVMIMTGTGSRYEDNHENGLAHFLEHMFFKGTKRRRNMQAISSELDAIGGEYNAFTGKDRTAYYAKVSAAHVTTALDVVSDLFLHSRLAPKDIDKERGAILQEIDMYKDMPARDVYHVFDALMYGKDHPLGREILGPKRNIKSFTQKDLRTYLKRCYTAKNTVVCVAGKFSERALLARIRKDFASLHGGDVPTCKPFIQTQKSQRIAIKDKRTDQTQIVLGVPSYDFTHKDRYVLSVLVSILSGGMSSRLFTEVREKRGLAYSVHASTEAYPDAGAFYVKAGVAHTNTQETITVILRELEKLTKKNVSNEELCKAKEYMKGHLVLGLETSDDIAGYLIAQEVVKGKVRLPEEIADNIDGVSAYDIKRVATELFVSKNLNLAIIGPHKKNQKKLQSLLKM